VLAIFAVEDKGADFEEQLSNQTWALLYGVLDVYWGVVKGELEG